MVDFRHLTTFVSSVPNLDWGPLEMTTQRVTQASDKGAQIRHDWNVVSVIIHVLTERFASQVQTSNF